MSTAKNAYKPRWRGFKSCLARQRGTSVKRLMEEMATLMLAEFDAEPRFALRAAREQGKVKRGLALLDKVAGRKA